MEKLPTWEETTPVEETLPTWEETKPVEQPKEATFMQGFKEGFLDQPELPSPHWYSPASVGHFTGSATPPIAGFLMAGPVGGMAGEAVKKAVGRGYEVAEDIPSKNEPIGKTLFDVGVSGLKLPGMGETSNAALEALGPKAGPIIENAAQAAAYPVRKVLQEGSGLLNRTANKIGSAFVKASQKLNAYGHNPIQAISDENIHAMGWEGFLNGIKDAFGRLRAMGDDIAASPDAQKMVNIDNVTSPIDAALKKLNEYPEVHESAIKRLTALKTSITNKINRETKTVANFEPVFTAGKETPQNWALDILSPTEEELGVGMKELAAPSKSLGTKGVAPDKQLQKWGYKEGVPSGDPASEVFDTKQVSSTRFMPVMVANQIKKDIYGLAKYSGNPSDDAVVNKAAQYVAAKINNVVGEAVPAMQEFNRRWGNLVALSKAATHRAAVAGRNDVVGLQGMGAIAELAHGNTKAAAALYGSKILSTPAATYAMSGIKGIPSTIENVASKATSAINAGLANAGPIASPAIEKATERSPHDVKADYKSGKITREQAISELKGYGFK